MKNINKYFLAIILIFLFAPVKTSLAQNFATDSKAHSYWEFGINGGLTQFYGDLWNGNIFNYSKDINTWCYGKGLTFGRQFNDVLGLRTQALVGELSGESEKFDARFTSDFLEFNLNTTINISNLINQNNVNKRINFYVILGAGLTNYQTTKYKYNSDAIIAQKGFNDGNGLDGKVLEFSYLGGLGLNIKLGDHWGIKLESANRLLQSDLIDITENDRKSDIYNYTSLGLQFRFGKAKKKAKSNNEITLGEINKQVIEDNKPKIEPVIDDVNKISNKETKQQPVIPPKEVEVKKGEFKEKVNNETPVKSDEKINRTPDLEYRIQIRACYKCRIPKELLGASYSLSPDLIKEDTHGSYYIYTIGSFATYEEANSARTRIIQINKIPDAFIVAFRKGARLSRF